MQVRTTSRTGTAGIALAVFALANLPPQALAKIPGYASFVNAMPELARWLWQPVRWAALIAIGLWLAHRLPIWRAGIELGIARPVLRPLPFCALCSLPMTLVPLFLSPIRPDLDAVELLFSAGVWVIAEEDLYRGYCFRQLYRRAGWSLYLAAAATGIVFGLVHLSNASINGLPWRGQILSIAMIGVGGVAFAWLFAAWRDNVWVPTFIHGFMNLGWSLYAIDDHPAAGWLVVTLRVAVISLAITGTVLACRFGWFGLAPPEPGAAPQDQ